MRMTILLPMAAIALIAGAPVLAQDAMEAKPMKKMTAAEMKKMKACQAMSHDAMMKDAGCAKLMKDHPDMMSHDDMMKPKS